MNKALAFFLCVVMSAVGIIIGYNARPHPRLQSLTQNVRIENRSNQMIEVIVSLHGQPLIGVPGAPFYVPANSDLTMEVPR